MTVPLVFGASIVAVMVLALFGDLEDETALLALATIGQTAVFIIWPLVVSRIYGTGKPSLDYGVRVQLPVDVGYGVAAALVGLIGGGAVAQFVAVLLDVDSGEAGNTGVLDDVEGSAWAPVMFVLIAFLIPIAEELMFRGLVMGGLRRRWGPTVAIWGSAAVFTLPHFVGGSLAETAVLYTQIFIYGVVLAWLVHKTGRLGPSIVAHICVNSLVVILAT